MEWNASAKAVSNPRNDLLHLRQDSGSNCNCCSAPVPMKMDAQRMLDSMLEGEDSDSSEGSDYTTEEADGAQHLVMHRRETAPAATKSLKVVGSVESARRSGSFEQQDWRKETNGTMMAQEGQESNILPTPEHFATRRSVSFGQVRQTARTRTHQADDSAPLEIRSALNKSKHTAADSASVFQLMRKSVVEQARSYSTKLTLQYICAKL